MAPHCHLYSLQITLSLLLTVTYNWRFPSGSTTMLERVLLHMDFGLSFTPRSAMSTSRPAMLAF